MPTWELGRREATRQSLEVALTIRVVIALNFIIEETPAIRVVEPTTIACAHEFRRRAFKTGVQVR